jgi:hypothetical protein
VFININNGYVSTDLLEQQRGCVEKFKKKKGDKFFSIYLENQNGKKPDSIRISSALLIKKGKL